MALNPYESKILTVLLKSNRFLTTAEIAGKAKISWNTAEHYLNIMEKKGWVKSEGNVQKYWKAILRKRR